MTTGLRARKLARTRLALLDAFLARLDERPVEEVSVRELCAAVEISEATFFNLFENKADLIRFFIQVWSVEVGGVARSVLATSGALAAIEAIFAATANDVAAHPRVFAEVVAAQARMEKEPALPDLPAAVRELRFPERTDLIELPAAGLDSLLPWLIGEAVARGELPADTDQQLLFLHLASIFFGTPVALRAIDPALVGPAWSAQLTSVWKGVR